MRLDKAISVVLIEFPFSNKDKTVSECKQVVLHIVSLDEHQERSLKTNHLSAGIISV
jgi:hypothetical protein